MSLKNTKVNARMLFENMTDNEIRDAMLELRQTGLQNYITIVSNFTLSRVLSQVVFYYWHHCCSLSEHTI